MSKKILIILVVVIVAVAGITAYFLIFRAQENFPNIDIATSGPLSDINSDIIISAKLKGSDILMSFATETIYPDGRYKIAADYRTTSEKTYVEIGGVEKEAGGFTQPLPGTYTFSLPQASSSYPLLIRLGNRIDRYNIKINEEKVMLTPSNTQQFTTIDPQNK